MAVTNSHARCDGFNRGYFADYFKVHREEITRDLHERPTLRFSGSPTQLTKRNLLMASPLQARVRLRGPINELAGPAGEDRDQPRGNTSVSAPGR
jgi:hypothetical protein